MCFSKAQLMKMADSGGNLYLRGTQITALPDNLTVGGNLDLRGTQITTGMCTRVNTLSDGDYAPGRYIYCDGILTHIRGVKSVKGYTLFVGKIRGYNVVYDGKNYAHCRNLREGIADLLFKSAADRGAGQYKGCALDTEVSLDEAVAMYRVITGACRQGSEAFVQSLGDTIKDKYTIREMIEITKGQYNADRFSAFFGC